jgi:polysaccharide export outer membrane protein
MKILTDWWKRGRSLVGVCAIALVLAGCHSAPKDEPMFSSDPGAASSSTATGSDTLATDNAKPATSLPNLGSVGRFRVGDLVTVTFSGLEQNQALPPHEERIKDDGTITLPMISSVLAKGKTAGELQNEIQEKYKKYYQRLVVTVKNLDSFYYVGGEVKMPNRQPWVGEVTVTQAIQSAGGFTDFANRKKVLLVRADRTKITVNCVKVLGNPSLDPKVYPGDTINVPRKWW